MDDVDLFTAGLAEYPLPGAAVGPTFTCIIGIQMYNLKFGDRFWFEHKDQVNTFTPGESQSPLTGQSLHMRPPLTTPSPPAPRADQLLELRKVSFSRLLCVNSDNLKQIQKNVYRGESQR